MAIKVSASDDVGVIRVGLYIDGMLKAAASQSYLSWNWNPRKEASGGHIVSAN